MTKIGAKSVRHRGLDMAASRKAYDGFYNRKMKRIIDLVVAIPFSVWNALERE